MIDMHIHTTESDGSNTMEDILQYCIQKKIKVLGITDHWKTKRYSEDFYVNDISNYLKRCCQLKETAYKYGIVVFAGLEVDFTEKYGFFIDNDDIKKFNQLDFILFEYVNTENESWGTVNGKSIDSLFEIRDHLTIPVGLAHNDFFDNFKNNYEAIIKEMSKKDIFLELCEGEVLGKEKVNALSLKKLLTLKKNMSDLDLYKAKAPIIRKKHMRNDMFYFEHFPSYLWELIKEYRLPLSVSTDNHSGSCLGEHPRADEYLKKYQLYDQLILGLGDDYEANLSR